jgi:hypothetical protein
MTLLPATKGLIDLARQGSLHWSLASAYGATIARLGAREDAWALFAAFLENPAKRAYMLTPIRVLGDGELAHELFQACVQNGRLCDGMPEDILLCLGYMGYVLAESLLWKYVAQKADYGDHGYDYGSAACLGLLHLPCVALKEAIAAEITSHSGKNWWDVELLPALACKTGHSSLLEELYQWGSTTASTDCNAGLVLGIALYGEQGSAYFKRLLWNPDWEAHASATGTRHYTYLGCRYLGISLFDLYSELQAHIQRGSSQKQLQYGFKLVESMLGCFIDDDGLPHQRLKFLPASPVSAQSVYETLFLWSHPNKDDSIIGLVGQLVESDADTRQSLQQGLYELEQSLLVRIEREIERQQCDSLRLL